MSKTSRAACRKSFKPMLEFLEDRTVPSGDLLAIGRVLTLHAGQTFNSSVALFSDPDNSVPQGTFSASIDWGDGHTSSGQVSNGDDGVFRVTGSHSYASAGVFDYTVQVNDTDGDSDTVHGRALVDTTSGSDLQAAGRLVSGVAGQEFSGTVAFVSDPDEHNTQGTLSATIDWGDGTTSDATVASGNDGFTVTGTHTYANAGFYRYSVQVSDTDGDSDSAHGIALIAPPNLSTGGDLFAIGRVVFAKQGQSFTGEVARFVDPDVGGTQGTLSATIDWGDGQTSTGQVSQDHHGRFTVTATHTYTATGTFQYAVNIGDTDGDSATVHGRAVVGTGEDEQENDLEAEGKVITPGAGQEFSGTVAFVSDPDEHNTQGTLSATIDWGDGTTSDATVTSGSDGFTVTGTHTYANAGFYRYSVQVSDTDGDSDSAHGAALVGPASGDLFAIGRNISPNSGSEFNGTVASFVDPDLGGTQGTLSATIDWGDGQTSTGQITQKGDGLYVVGGTHTYSATGTFQTTISITDTDGDSATVHGTSQVGVPGNDLQALGGFLVVEAGEEFSGRVATVTDPDPSATQGTVSATIDWGDGTTSDAQVVSNGDSFKVVGTHTYATAGHFRYTVQITDTDGDSATAHGQAFVAADNGRLAAVGNGGSGLFVVDGNGNLFFRQGNTWVAIGGFIDQISATTDGSGTPVVFAITKRHDLVRFDQLHGWQLLGSFIDSLASGNANGSPVVFVITSNHDLFRFGAASGWQQLASFIDSMNVTPGTDGNPVVFLVTTRHDLFRLDDHGLSQLGNFINNVSAATDASGNPVAFLVSDANDLFRLDNHGLARLGGFISSVSAGTDENGQAEADVVTTSGKAFRNNGQGAWSDLNVPESAQALLAANGGQTFSVGQDGTVFQFDHGHGWLSLGKPGK